MFLSLLCSLAKLKHFSSPSMKVALLCFWKHGQGSSKPNFKVLIGWGNGRLYKAHFTEKGRIARSLENRWRANWKLLLKSCREFWEVLLNSNLQKMDADHPSSEHWIQRGWDCRNRTIKTQKQRFSHSHTSRQGGYHYWFYNILLTLEILRS